MEAVDSTAPHFYALQIGGFHQHGLAYSFRHSNQLRASRSAWCWRSARCGSAARASRCARSA